jgi:2,3-bisphosphoglycerate-dependent phosphoglycerate mutase
VTTPLLREEIERHHRLRHPGQSETGLLLVRHGRTLANRKGLFLGATDVPLDAFGRLQARLVADRIAREWPADAIVTSPLQRARTTAAAVAARLAIEPRVVDDLREMDFGRFEGHSFAEIARLDPAFVDRLADIADDDLAWPGGEQRRAFYERIWVAFGSIVADYGGQRVVVVAHGGVIGAFMAMLRGQRPSDPRVYGLKNCSVTHVVVGPEATEVRRFNCVVHLDDLDGPCDDEDEDEA